MGDLTPALQPTAYYRAMRSFRIVVWNARWAAASTPRGRKTIEVLESLEPDVVCITEGTIGLHPPGGHAIVSDADYGYRAPASRRKVILWSRLPWHDVDDAGHAELPGGRFVSGTTNADGITVRVIGICIPWRDAHVSTGRRDSKPWDQHLEYLTHLAGIVGTPPTGPLIVAGDFNQRVPRIRQPVAVAAALEQALNGTELVTAGRVPGIDKPLIDHVTLRGALSARRITGISRRATNIELSDHDGVAIDIAEMGSGRPASG